MADITKRLRPTRRQFLSAALVSGIGLGSYMHWGEAQWLEINRHDVPVPQMTGGQSVRLVHLSDLHASSCVPLEYLDRSVTLALQQSADVFCLTGDFITTRFDDFDSYAKILCRLSVVAPCYACLGNHDGGDWISSRGGYADTGLVRQLLKSAGITLLDNASKEIHVRNMPVRLVGVGDWWAGEMRPDRAFADQTKWGQAPIVLLSHNPDSKGMLLEHAWNVMLCGHTHGGQVELPLLGAPFAPVGDKRFVRGLHSWEERWLHVTKGVGNLHGVRLNCRPEISVLDLVPAMPSPQSKFA